MHFARFVLRPSREQQLHSSKPQRVEKDIARGMSFPRRRELRGNASRLDFASNDKHLDYQAEISSITWLLLG
jgi:hypothetical protein